MHPQLATHTEVTHAKPDTEKLHTNIARQTEEHTNHAGLYQRDVHDNVMDLEVATPGDDRLRNAEDVREVATEHGRQP